PVDSGQSSTEPESFSDSYSHLSPSADETPAPPLSKNLHSVYHLINVFICCTTVDPTEPAPETEPELRRRRLEALEKIGQCDEEEEAEEDFQLPQRDEDSGITLNKCILGAVILLGLGTIFMSGKERCASTTVQNCLLTELSISAAATAPLSGQMENHSHKPGDHQMHKKDKYDRGVTKDWKDGEKSESKKEKKQRKDGGKTEGKEKEWKKDKSEGGGFEKRYKEDKHAKQKDEVKEWKTKQKDEAKEWKTKQKDEAKEWKTKQKDEAKEWKTKQKNEAKEWKKDKSNRGDEGKPWKEKKEKKEWTYEGDKKHKHDQVKEGRSKENKYSQETHKGPGDKHWKKGRDDYKEEKDKYEKKEKGKEKKWAKDEKKQWKNEDKEKKRVEFKEKKHQKEWEEGHFEKYNKHKSSEDKDHTWNDKKPKPKVGQPEYWSRQRERLQHSSKPQHPCDSPDTCAQAEGVQPVLLSEFESILKNYLSKAEKAGVEPSHIAELQKLATEMFQNGVFPHDQMSFQDYVEDVGDILEDLVEGEDGSEEEEDSAIEDEMEGFEMEVMEKFMLPGKKEGVKAEFGKESGRGRG
uniref:Pre-B-cell leukemia homeobox interacting protein 1b n=1 Tax=Periophthalmus magnuspinnatus TaxID=409849 RepID=A0A3B4A0V4_9GOBI